ncbi:AAA family ATPase [Rhizobium grahamii]|uniref:AAA family ATPase n=1 Tax=Rhizobium grahamii TaxID=1120045 RepID=A0A5Q0C3K9_9HYPH|nr:MULTISPECIES: AAA family ATPase [Rhizobium]QFY60488.1 AAA family ATPase [Rhizobium grahamii]QRM50384.1 AAA family ATPase [Rhizobium sp. BG6]
MQFVDAKTRNQKLSKDSGMFLAGCGLVRATKAIGRLRYGVSGFLVFVVPPGYRTEEYEAAALAILGTLRDRWADDWVDKDIRVRLANPVRKKGAPHRPASIFDLKGLDILIARDIAEVPKDVRFAAMAVLFVEPPTAQHINAARRISGKAPLSDVVLSGVVNRPQNVVLAAVLKPSFDEDGIQEIDDFERLGSVGPSLFELPGYDEVKPWARDLVENVSRWRQRTLEWKLARASVLVSGLPGTGKTLFASALATALGMRLVSTTVGAWQSTGTLDDMLAAMRKTFDDVNDGKGAVLFIDEIDAIGTRLSRPSGHHGDQYWQVVVTDFLTLLSGLGEGIVVVGATNYPDWIDPAILRAGRIDDHFELSLPDRLTRAKILNHHAGGSLPLESLIDIAEELDGKAGADLERLVGKALNAARNEGRDIELSDLEAQLPEKLLYTSQQLLRLAAHEVGHALAALALGHAASATIEIKDSFDPSLDGFLGGKTTFDLVPDYFPTTTTLRNRIAVSLSGMAAEVAVFGDPSIGSGGTIGSDIERATAVARRMIGSYGLGKTPVFMGTVKELASKPLPERLEVEVSQILDEEYERVLSMMMDGRDRILALAADVVTHRIMKIERSGVAEAA